MKKDKFKIIISFIILLTFGFKCGVNEDDQYENIFELELPFEIITVQREYKISDTIQISAIINNNSLKELRSQKQIAIKCTDIPIYFYVGVRHENFNLLDSDDLFEMIIDTLNFKNHHIENNGQFSEFQANISEDIFNKEEVSIMKLIPKRKGIFMINPDRFGAVFINSNGDCNATNPILDKGIMNYIFDVVDSNKELLKESPLPESVFISGDRVPILTAEKRIFWFKVVD
ncbi:MAG: hypothetical protein M3Q56_07230 [Bacteroidota bacterium]|nr:hypothetical protein [Bacteroidota bacterium]